MPADLGIHPEEIIQWDGGVGAACKKMLIATLAVNMGEILMLCRKGRAGETGHLSVPAAV